MLLIHAFLLLAAGLTVLILGAEYLVRGASNLAVRSGIPSLVVGLTVVAFGTSAPELAVSLRAVVQERSSIGLGNIVGSNVFNILFILGLSAAINEIRVSRQLIRLDVPLMLGVSVLVYLLAADTRISTFDGTILVAGILGYVWLLLSTSRKRRTQAIERALEAAEENYAVPKRHWLLDVLSTVAGIAMLVFGAQWSVDGATQIAAAVGMSDLIVGMTIVAIGTSLPEVATSVVASMHRQGDISVGNIVGSNIFNLMAVLGLTATFSPRGIPVPAELLSFEMPVMIAAAFVCLPIFFTSAVISRWEGWLLLFYYIAFMAFLLLRALGSPYLGHLNAFLLFAAFPATAAMLLASVWQSIKR